MLSLPLPDPVTDEATSLHDLGALADQLRHGLQFRAHGHQAVTVVHRADLRVVLLAMRAGAHVREHQVPAESSVQTLRGKVGVHVGDRCVIVAAGQLLALDRDVPHDVEAVEDSVILVTIAWSPENGRARH